MDMSKLYLKFLSRVKGKRNQSITAQRVPRETLLNPRQLQSRHLRFRQSCHCERNEVERGNLQCAELEESSNCFREVLGSNPAGSEIASSLTLQGYARLRERNDKNL